MLNYSRLICALFIGGLLFLSSPFVKADTGSLPGEMFTAIMLKALNYDRNIDRQAKDKVVIGIVNFSDDAAAQDFANQVKNNIDKVQSNFFLKDKSVDSNVLFLEKQFDKIKFEEQLKQSNISVLVVAVNDAASINSIIEMTQKLQISSVCGIPGCSHSGVGLEIIKGDNKPRMVVNLNTLKKEGSDYNSKFLFMCDVVK